MLSKICRYSLSLILGTCLSSSAMDRPDKEKPAPIINRAVQIPREFKSAEEMKAYTAKLSQTFSTGNLELAFALASHNPSISFMPIIQSDYEDYLFNRTFALVGGYRQQIEKTQINPKEAITINVKALKEINNYLGKYGSFTSQNENFKNKMLWHRYHIYKLAGDAYFSVAILKKNSLNDNKEQRITAYKNAIAAYEDSVSYGCKVLALPPTLWKPSQDIFKSEYLPGVRVQLISVCCSFAQLSSDDEASLLMEKARTIYERGKQDKWAATQLKSALGFINTTEKLLKAHRQTLISQKSKKVEKFHRQNFNKTVIEAVTEVQKISHEVGVEKFLNARLRQKYLSLSSLVSDDLVVSARNAKELKEGLLDIENTVAKHLPLESNLVKNYWFLTQMFPSDEIATNYNIVTKCSLFQFCMDRPLEVIYERLPALLTMETMQDAAAIFIPAFIQTGDLEGAVQRADLFKGLEIKYYGKVRGFTRFIAAFAKNLVGNHEEWLRLEEEAKEITHEKEEKKKAEKEKIEHQRAESIKFFLSQQQEKKENLPAPKKAPTTGKTLETPSLDEKENLTFEEPQISDKERRLGKQQRHEEAKAKRQQNMELPKVSERDQNIPLPSIKTEKLSKEAELERILASSDQSLRELYHLSSDPLKVDEEIEQGTWRFTRDQFQTYMEAMDCIYKSGKGIHIKTSLPKATHVMQGDNVITILNDFGGALTLPQWDKDYVPDYLKTQILEARKKLRALKIKAQATVKG